MAQHPGRGPESAWDRRASTRNALPAPRRKGRGADFGGWKEAARPRPHQLRRVLLFSAAACASVPSPSAAARASSSSLHRFHQPSPHEARGSSSSRLRVGHARTAISMLCRLQLCGRGWIRSWGSNKVQLHSSLHPTRQSSPEREIRSLACPMAPHGRSSGDPPAGHLLDLRQQ
jgi:hypothetical protein